MTTPTSNDPLDGLTAGTTLSVRDLLRRFGASRRGYRVVAQIRRGLDAQGLVTDPDFESLHIDALTLLRRPDAASEPARGPEQAAVDPVQRIGRLVNTQRALVSVRPGCSLLEATTLMMMRDFSQLPVLRTEYDCLGLVSWRSIGTVRTLGRVPETVDDCLESVEIFESDEPMSHVIGLFGSEDAILVRDGEGKISGILTSSDVSLQFHELGEPFLVLSEIENHVRALLDASVSVDELAEGVNPDGPAREVSSAADLTFGEYRRLLERPAIWTRVGLQMDRATFVRELDEVRKLRNDVMHFDPDGLAPEDLRRLREFGEFMRRVVAERGVA